MPGDVVKEYPFLFLGSRLKRLAERMQGEIVRVSGRAGLELQPSQHPILLTLDLYGPITIGALSDALQVSQPSVTRAVGRLAEAGLVSVTKAGRDQRCKTVTLTLEGVSTLEKARAVLWPYVEAVARELFGGLSGPMLDQVSVAESRMDEKSFGSRMLAHSQSGLRILEFSDELADNFRLINEEWIGSMYRLEPTDIEILSHPREHIISRGGTILFVEAEGLGVVGTCALQKVGERRFELTKMGVLEAARGRKAGEFLLQAVLQRAEALGAELLYLLSNSKSAAAVHLYEKAGFVHDSDIMREFGARYTRCNIAMRYLPENRPHKIEEPTGSGAQ
ncbi:MAG: bifunctional helix-turn-helix transcriptional regulator/GNAT family N-acetyltransferase [Methylorubrum populi]